MATQPVDRPSEPAMGALLVCLLDHGFEAPAYAHPGDAGLDLRATVDVTLAPCGGRAVVPVGIAVALPPGTAGFVLPRSGLAARHGITVVNAPGLVDEGYRGEIKVALLNTDPVEPYEVRRGDRVAQLVVQRIEAPPIQLVASLDDLATTSRGSGGHGSSGR